MKRTIALLLACLSGGWLMAGHWTPVGAPYEENMALTCVVQINGVEQATETLEVGVFCGTECRGAMQPAFFPPTQRYIYQITVFGEEGDMLTFRLYDHALQQELDLFPPDEIIFHIDGYGTLPNPYMLNFRESYEITVMANPSEGGTVDGMGTYLHGETCTLTATANGGYTFTNWKKDGTVVSTNPTYSFTVTESGDYVANFAQTICTVIISANPAEGGTINGNASGNYEPGSTCTVTATANTGYTFLYWTANGALLSTNPTCTFTVTGDMNCVARFYSSDATLQISPFASGWTWYSTYILTNLRKVWAAVASKSSLNSST